MSRTWSFWNFWGGSSSSSTTTTTTTETSATTTAATTTQGYADLTFIPAPIVWVMFAGYFIVSFLSMPFTKRLRKDYNGRRFHWTASRAIQDLQQKVKDHRALQGKLLRTIHEDEEDLQKIAKEIRAVVPAVYRSPTISTEVQERWLMNNPEVSQLYDKMVEKTQHKQHLMNHAKLIRNSILANTNEITQLELAIEDEQFSTVVSSGMVTTNAEAAANKLKNRVQAETAGVITNATTRNRVVQQSNKHNVVDATHRATTGKTTASKAASAAVNAEIRSIVFGRTDADAGATTADDADQLMFDDADVLVPKQAMLV